MKRQFLEWMILPAAIPLAIWAGRKAFRSISEWILSRIIQDKHPENQKLALAIVKWAEAKLPAKGTGAEKFKLVDEILSHYLDNPEQRKRLIESTVDSMEENLKLIETGIEKETAGPNPTTPPS